MFPEVMLGQEMIGQAGRARVHEPGQDRHFCDLFQNEVVPHGLGRAGAPAEGPVPRDERRRPFEGIQPGEPLGDDLARVRLVIGFDFRRRQLARL